MKRIQHACLEQTIHFALKEDLPHSEAAELVKKDLENYKMTLERRRVKYKIREELTLPDGSILVKVGKQYNSYSCGSYLN
ncbi:MULTISPECIES: hypothetical protein [Anaerotruncus]|jgi:hypothetical protein|uniref:hypothetical protein n=1 Tax=Anaerotruncus TaxID=244127 RepID=UPI00083471D7|nr:MULTISPECIES: hypothetical protein [Anaerotruncus]RGX54814.1 hypothetical protein DWV16_12150 [Anaerotruncus sp. AF02-27]